MTPTPKAEEVADACVRLCEANDGTSACEKCVVQALTAYADERVKEDLETKCFCAVRRSYYSLRCKGCHGIIRTDWEPEERLREARAEALEEAAKIIEKHDDCPCHGSPVRCKTWLAWEEIRDLKGDQP